MNQATQSTNVEETLNKTDLGHAIYENRKILVSLLIAVLVGVSGYALWKQNKKSSALDNAVSVFEFQNKTWESAKDGKLAIAELVRVFEGLDKDVQQAPVMVPLALEMGKFLIEKGALNEAEAILSKAGTNHQVSAFFVSMQRAVVLENLQKIDEAIVVLEKLAQHKDVLMPAKVNLELGRLNMIKGEKGKSQTHLEYVINTYPNDEHAKLAKLYLSQLGQ
jgi:predicted negative regulator of RcsB-dependent stress response